MRKMKSAPSRIVNTGHRCPERDWKRFMSLCEQYGISANNGLTRLMLQALQAEKLPFKKLPPTK